jgi:hypothetical protein
MFVTVHSRIFYILRNCFEMYKLCVSEQGAEEGIWPEAHKLRRLRWGGALRGAS